MRPHASKIRVRFYRPEFSHSLGPILPTWALQQVGSYLRYTFRDARILREATLTQRRINSSHLYRCGIPVAVAQYVTQASALLARLDAEPFARQTVAIDPEGRVPEPGCPANVPSSG